MQCPCWRTRDGPYGGIETENWTHSSGLNYLGKSVRLNWKGPFIRQEV